MPRRPPVSSGSGKGRSIPGMAKGRPIPGVSTTPIPGQPSKFPGTAARHAAIDQKFHGGGIYWDGLGVLIENTSTRGEAIFKAAVEASEEFAQEMEDFAKERAPWHDDTGDARSGIRHSVTVNEEAQSIIIQLGHTVGYGMYLETMQGGLYAIIMPTIRIYAPLTSARIRAKRPLAKDLKKDKK